MASNVSSRFFGFNSHSHIVMQCQPIAANLCCSSLSRSLFLRILFTQNSLFVFGILQHDELSIINSPLSIFNSISCPCQKHPLIKMHVLYFLSTKSGCPGSRLWFSLYLNPLFHSPLLTIISGLVFFEWIAAMLACRCWNVSLSMIHHCDNNLSFEYSCTMIIKIFSATIVHWKELK